MKIIPLGACCEIVFMLQQLKSDQLRYPFDWLHVKNFDVIMKVLDNDFEGFFDVYLHDRSVILRHYDIEATHGWDINKLQRRIDRFRVDVKGTEFVVFLIKLHIIFPGFNYSTNMEDMNKIRKFRDILNRYREGDFKLIIVNESHEQKSPIVEDNIIICWIHGNVPVNCNSFGPIDQWKDILNTYCKD